MTKGNAKAFKIIRKMNSFEYVKDHAPNKLGVYVMNHAGKVMYVGSGCETDHGVECRGLRKTLQDLWYGKVKCNPELFRKRDHITVKFRVCQTIEETMKLEKSLITEFKTKIEGWNL